VGDGVLILLPAAPGHHPPALTPKCRKIILKCRFERAFETRKKAAKSLVGFSLKM
jgi:hypothetical protein